MFGGSDLRASGAVKTGVALEGKDRESSIAAGGDGMAAEFSGGFLTATNFPGTLLKDCPEFTLSLRMKSREGPISGTVMVQRGTMKPGSGAFDVSGWHMPFMKRNHLGFHGMITDGLEPNMGNSQFSTVNMSLPSDTGWHDVVVVREKGGPLNLYFDGKLIQSRKGSSWMPGNKLPFEGAESALIFGALPDGTASFRGWIDHAAFWDRALTPAELARLGITETPAPAMKPPLATVGSGIFPDTTPMPERYDWLDAEMPAFRAQLQKNDPHLPRYHIALPGEQWNPIAFYHKGRYSDKTGRSINECGQLLRIDGWDVFTTIHDLAKNQQYMTGTIRPDGTFDKKFAGTVDRYNCVNTAVNEKGEATQWRYLREVRPYRLSSADGWWNTYGVPRRVHIDESGRMLFSPDPSLEKLHGPQVALDKLKASSSDVKLTFVAGEAGQTGIRLTDGKNHLDAFYDHAKRQIAFDFSGLDESITKAKGKTGFPVTVKPGDTVTLRFFSDRSIFELYANDEVVLSSQAFFHDPENLRAELIQRGGAAAEVAVEAWEMEPLKWTAYKPGDKAMKTTK